MTTIYLPRQSVWQLQKVTVTVVLAVNAFTVSTTEEALVRKLWSFYYRFIGLKCHNYALYLCFVLYIYIKQDKNSMMSWSTNFIITFIAQPTFSTTLSPFSVVQC